MDRSHLHRPLNNTLPAEVLSDRRRLVRRAASDAQNYRAFSSTSFIGLEPARIGSTCFLAPPPEAPPCFITEALAEERHKEDYCLPGRGGLWVCTVFNFALTRYTLAACARSTGSSPNQACITLASPHLGYYGADP